MLEPKEVKPDKLLLDPNNPRLARNFRFDGNVPLSGVKAMQPQIERLFSIFPDLTSSRSQDGTDELIDDRDEVPDHEFFSIGELKDSMRHIGFVGIQNIIVRSIPQTDTYVVLEGNRRVASIKAVLAKHNRALPGNKDRIEDQEILQSLLEIEVMVLSTDGASEDDIRTEVDRMLGLRHYGSRLNWELLPRAKNIYDEYLKLSPPPFTYEPKHANSVAEIIAKSRSEVRKLLKGYICYEQLASIYPVAPHHFSLVLAGVENSNLAKAKFFEIDGRSFELIGSSVEAMNKVCEFENRDRSDFTKTIRDPKQFKKLGTIKRDAVFHAERSVKDYASGLFEDVCEKEQSLDEAYSDLTAFKKRLMWVQTLSKLLEKQAGDSSLVPEKYIGIGETLRLRDEIVELVRKFRAIMSVQ